MSETDSDAIAERDVDEAVALLTTTVLHAADKSIPMKADPGTTNHGYWQSYDAQSENGICHSSKLSAGTVNET